MGSTDLGEPGSPHTALRADFFPPLDTWGTQGLRVLRLEPTNTFHPLPCNEGLIKHLIGITAAKLAYTETLYESRFLVHR